MYTPTPAYWTIVIILALVLILLILAEEFPRRREPRRRAGRASTRPRTIKMTYGPGCGLLGWEEEWEWHDVPPSLALPMYRLQRHFGKLNVAMFSLSKNTQQLIDLLTNYKWELKPKNMSNPGRTSEPMELSNPTYQCEP